MGRGGEEIHGHAQRLFRPQPGHNHPAIIKAAKDQLDRITLTSRAFLHDKQGAFFKKLSALAGKDKILPMNSGAEAVETALKAVRKWGYKKKGVPEGKAEIIVCDGNFHGRTVTIVGFSTEAQYKDGFGPFTPGFTVVPYGDIKALEKAITPNTVAFMVEPIQGEAGVVVPPAGYLAEAYGLCTRNKVLFVADEIQTGFGRTGRMFCCDHEEVKADVYVMGKALGGASSRLRHRLRRRDHGRLHSRRPRLHLRRQPGGLRRRERRPGRHRQRTPVREVQGDG